MTEPTNSQLCTGTPVSKATVFAGIALAVGLLGSLVWWRGDRLGSQLAQRIGRVTAGVSVLPGCLALYHAISGKLGGNSTAREEVLVHEGGAPPMEHRSQESQPKGGVDCQPTSGGPDHLPFSFDDGYDPESCVPAELRKAIERLADLFPPRTKENGWQRGPGRNETQIEMEAFCEYKTPIAKDRHFYILPFFEVTEENAAADLCKLAGDYLEAVFGRPCTIWSPVTRADLQKTYEQRIEKSNQDKRFPPVESEWQDLEWNARGQLNADFCLLRLLPLHRPKRYASIVMLTDRDLHPGPRLGSWSFVFGQGNHGSGVWSTHRFGQIGTREFETRFLKLTAHEVGHSILLSHCVDYACDINGYDSIADLDACPMYFCANHLAKICFLTQTTPIEHCEAMKGFYQKHGYEDEAVMMDACLERLRAT